MSSKFILWTNRAAMLFLALAVTNITLSSCAYKEYHFKGKPRVIGSYLSRYMFEKNYLILYGSNAKYHLANKRLEHDTLYGELAPIDAAYLPYLVSDTVNPNFKALEHRYLPAQGVHILTNTVLDTVSPSIQIPVDSILSIKVYHWKMTTTARVFFWCSAGGVLIGFFIACMILIPESSMML